MIYLDNAATTKPCAAAEAAFLSAPWGNPSSLHGVGLEAERAVAAAAKTITGFLPTENSLCLFTSGATEAGNLAIFGLAGSNSKAHIIISTVEHPAVAAPALELERRGFTLTRINPWENPADFVESNTTLVSFMSVCNETGHVVNNARFYSDVKRANPRTIFHTDAVQGFLKVPLFADAVSISAHKIHGYKGVGALALNRQAADRLKPVLFGGGQQDKLRPGTEAVGLIAAFAAAARVNRFDLQHFSALESRLLAGLQLSPALSGVVINSLAKENLPHLPTIVNLSFPGNKSEILLHKLEAKGIFVSSGSACSRGKPSAVLKALGVPEKLADSAIRISFSKGSKPEEVDRLLEALETIII